MSKLRTAYVCSECGREYAKRQGQCASCGSWNTIEENDQQDFSRMIALPKHSAGFAPLDVKTGALHFTPLSQVSCEGETRFDTGMTELNRVLGGGLVKGSVVLISGDPGIGKSTLLLQICRHLCAEHGVLYASGEESERQLKLRADRLQVSADKLLVSSATDCVAIVGGVLSEKTPPDVIIVDSIQTMIIPGISSSAGSVTQVRECANLFLRLAKTKNISVFLVGHVNKDGGVAGPMVLEHIVDTVLHFEGERQQSYRILRALKNRFGSTNEIGVFEMQNRGLAEVSNPSALLIAGRPTGVAGVSVLATMEGSRPILAEVQALVTKSGFGTPRRVSDGFDYSRLCLIIAVLEKRTGFLYGQCDVYVNIVGGLTVDEPAADLAVAAALYSGLTDKPLPESLIVFGEVGLGGELRGAPHTRQRLKEAQRLGFTHAIIPKSALKELDKAEKYGLRIIGAATLTQAFNAVDRIVKEVNN
jgi:DNA repair protein RadA/Sms